MKLTTQRHSFTPAHHPPTPSRTRRRPPPAPPTASGSTRIPKDPSSYTSIEDLRRELEAAKGQAPFTITRTIKWLSDAANNGGAGLAFQAYRWVLGLDQPPNWGWRRPADISAPELLEIEERTDPELLDAISALLMIPRRAAVKLVYRCPAAAHMTPGELMSRLVDLKSIFPGSNVARMVELTPTAFLVGDWDETATRLRATSSLLREGLVGADVDAMFEADPTILFEEPGSVEVGLSRMAELWRVDALALKNSDPEEIALAVRALSLTGPPKNV
jgi:hypothetical protein